MNYRTLIDRKNDPNELKNVYGDPAYASTVGELHAKLKRLRAELNFQDGDAAESKSRKDRSADGKGKRKNLKQEPVENRTGCICSCRHRIECFATQAEHRHSLR